MEYKNVATDGEIGERLLPYSVRNRRAIMRVEGVNVDRGACEEAESRHCEG